LHHCVVGQLPLLPDVTSRNALDGLLYSFATMYPDVSPVAP